MARSERVGVYCHSCGWSGRRVKGECACYDEWAMYCACSWGHCPKCSKRVTTTSPARQSRLDAQTDAFLASPEGRALMAKHTEEKSK